MGHLLRALTVLFVIALGLPVHAQITTITFSEFLPTCDERNPPPFSPPCVNVGNQYASQGIVFIGTPNLPITQDDPTYPPAANYVDTVGTPTLGPWLAPNNPWPYGAILARFVDPKEQDGTHYVSRRNVQFDGCAFDAVGSTTVSWLDINGAVIASQANTGAETGNPVYCEPMVAPGLVSGFQIQITCSPYPYCETAGYVIDNVQFGPAVYCTNSGAPNCNHSPSQDKDLGCHSDSVGDPCFPGTGNNFQHEKDYASPALSFSRYYNSGLADMNVGLGYGWTSTFHRGLEFYVDGETGIDGAVSVRLADGRAEPFKHWDGIWNADSDSTSTLVQSPTGYTYTTADKFVATYDLSGRLLTEADRNGYTITYAYSQPTGLLAQVTDSFGAQISFTYSTDGHLQSMTDPAGGVMTYGYDTTGNLISATDNNNVGRTYEYESTSWPHNLTGITDEASNRYATWTYDTTTGRVLSSQHAGGADLVTLSYSSTSGPWNTTVTDALNTSRVYSFLPVLNAYKTLNISQPCYDCGNAAARSYDADGNVVSLVDFQGNRTCYEYNGGTGLTRNLETTRVEGFAPSVRTCPSSLASYSPAAGTRERKITTTWNATFPFPASVVQADRTTSFTYDSHGNVLTRTVTDTTSHQGASRTWTYTYNNYGQVLTENGPRTDVNDVMTYTYYTCSTGYQCGRIQTITNALGQAMTFNSYNAYGQPTQSTDFNGIITTIAYDSHQRMTARCVNGLLPSCTGGELTSYTYWPTFQLKSVTYPDASSILLSYDPAHRLIQITDNGGNYVSFTLDPMGNQVLESVYDATNTLRRTHKRTIDSFNRLQQDIGAAGTSDVSTVYAYDNNGNRTTVTAPLSRVTTNAYDELNRLKQITDPANGNTQFAYSAEDDLTSVIDARGLVTSYQRNGFGELTSQTSPDTGTSSYTYDSGGNRNASTDARGSAGAYTYDAANRLKSASYTLKRVTDQTITFSYDAGTYGKNRLTGASDANHSLSWGYDPQGHVAQKTQVVSGVTLNVSYTYTTGHLTTMAYPSGQTVTYGYNGLGQPTSVQIGATTILSQATYEPLGAVNGWTWGNGSGMSRTFSQDGRVTETDSIGRDRGYGYDNALRIISFTDIANPSNSWSYGYDNLDRITSAVRNVGTTRGWTYDASGNRLTETGTAPSTYTVSSSSNRVSSISGALSRTYAYDASGNSLTYASVTLAYTNQGRLRSTKNGTATRSYINDAFGRLINASGGTGGTVYFAYDEGGHLIGEYGSGGTLIQETVWLGDIPVATIRPGTPVQIYYVQTDELNTPRAVTRPSDNAMMWQWESDPFGTDLPNQNPQGLGTFVYDLRFAGQIYDPQAGLYNNWHRDYDPAVGRYAESDPIGLEAGPNTYIYGYDAPSMNYDRDGLDAIDYMRDHPLGLGDGPSWLSPAVKQLVCKTLADCAGNMNCVYNTLNAARKAGSWSDPILRQAENFATAAADNSALAYPYSWAAHNQLGIWWYQYQTKPWLIQHNIPTTPVSDDAYAAGVAGSYFHGLDPSVAQKWCQHCDKH